METLDVDALQRQLAERIAQLDKQRKDEAERFNKEAADRLALAELERAAQLAAYQEAEKKRNAKKAAEEEAEKLRAQEARKVQVALENSLAAAEEARKAQEGKLAWLVAEINKQEFVEEQHRKAMQSAKVYVDESVNPTEINVEHPSAPDAKGEAVQGTEGSTPGTPLMSEHLKMILRQAQRSY